MRMFSWLRFLLGGVLVLGLISLVAWAQEPVKIGVLTPLSPPGAYLSGQLIVRGAELGRDYVNEIMGGVLGGRPIELVIEDDAGTPEKALAGYRKLAIQDGVVAILGQVHSSNAMAIKDLAEDIGVPWFGTKCSSSAITAAHLHTTFRTHAIDVDRAITWLDFIQHMGYDRIALLAENTDYGIGLVEWTKTLMAERHMDNPVKTVIFDRSVVDFTPQLLEIKAWAPDLVIQITGSEQVGYLIINQGTDIGLFPGTPHLYSCDHPSRSAYWENVRENGNYLMYITYYHPGMPLTWLGEWLKAKYFEKYGEMPIYDSFNSFSQVVIIAQALNLAGSDDPSDLVSSLESWAFLTWSGVAQFEEPAAPGDPKWHNASPPLMIVQYTAVDQAVEDAVILFPPDKQTGTYTAP